MGLGKTIEIMDLILMHPQLDMDLVEPVMVDGRLLRSSKGTVIITPPTICMSFYKIKV